MANTKGKIIIGSAIAVVGGLITWKIIRNVKQNKIKKSILAQINDPKNVGATLSDTEMHKYTKGLDPSFWKKEKGSPLPSKLMNPKDARKYAKKIYDNSGGSWGWDNEDVIMSTLKKAKTQGQLSQIAFAYESAPLNKGNMGDMLESNLEAGTFEKDRLKELNNWINSLPY